MNINLLDPLRFRKQVIADIKTWENVERKRSHLGLLKSIMIEPYQYVLQ